MIVPDWFSDVFSHLFFIFFVHKSVSFEGQKVIEDHLDTKDHQATVVPQVRLVALESLALPVIPNYRYISNALIKHQER